MTTSPDKKRLRSIHSDMKRRCGNPQRHCFKWYGARGISVCDEWQSIGPFYEWAMANGYAPGLTIDREDVNGNYEPSNCRWVTIAEQERNRRDTDHLTFAGRTQCLRVWARELGMHQQTLWRRLYVYAWPVDKALSTPVGAR